MDVGITAQWFPEYALNLGAPASGPAADIAALREPGGLYVRRFDRGLVAVNPDDHPHWLTVPGLMYLTAPHGGGALDARADTAGWGMERHPVSGALQLAPDSGDVLLSH